MVRHNRPVFNRARNYSFIYSRRWNLCCCEPLDQVVKTKILKDKPSLVRLSSSFIANNLERYYRNGDYESIKMLPQEVKDIVLYFLTLKQSQVPEYLKAIKSLIHPRTRCLNVTLADPNLITDDFLSLLDVCTRLETVAFGTLGPPRISKEAWMSFFQRHRNLTMIYLVGCTTVDDCVLKSIATNCPNLKIIYVGKENRREDSCITDDGISAFSNLEKLQVLSCAFCNLSSSGLEKMLNGPCGNSLRALKLKACNITKRDASALEEKYNIKICNLIMTARAGR